MDAFGACQIQIEAFGTREQPFERDLHLKPGKGRSQAMVNADVERNVATVRPIDIEGVRILELSLVVVGR